MRNIIFIIVVVYSTVALVKSNSSENRLAQLEGTVAQLMKELKELRQLVQDSKAREKKQVSSTVSFSTRLSLEVTGLGRQQPVVFDEVIENSGGGYNTADGIFTVPVSGVYVFTWTISTRGGRWQSTELVKQGKVYGYSLADSIIGNNDNDYSTASNTVVLAVKAGDRVFVRTGHNGNGILDGHFYDTFSGWIIQETD